MFMVYSGYDVMTKPDFAELKERLCRKQYVDIYVQREHDTAIITELLEIIQSQSETILDFYKTAQRIDKFGYGVNIESKGIISNTEEILVNTCANAIVVITETNTRLQKLRDGKI
jgi:hypothetical protein